MRRCGRSHSPGSRVVVLVLGIAILGGGCLPREDVAKPPPAKSGARRGGVIHAGISEPVSIDPALAGDPGGLLVAQTICDTLIQIDPISGELKPAIAKSWQVTDGGKTITINLRKGVRFHNGKELSAQDVIYSLSRIVRQETASPFANLFQPVKGFANLRNPTPADLKKGQLGGGLSGLKSIEKYSLEIGLDRPDADFVRLLAQPFASVLPKDSADTESFSRKPVCAGPYMVTDPWTAGSPAVKVARFPGYYAQNAGFSGGGRGYAKAIEFSVTPDRAAESAEFQAGRLQVAHLPGEKAADTALGTDLVRGAGSTLEYIGLPTRQAPFDNPSVRLALSTALDRKALVSTVFSGQREPAGGFLPPALGKVHRSAACAVQAPIEGDLQAAKQILAKAGVDLNGKSAKLYFNDEFRNKAVVDEAARQWQEAFGLKIEATPMVWEKFLTLGSHPPGFDAPFRMSWAGEYPSADSFLGPLFASSSIYRDNLSRYDNPDFDQALERKARRAASEQDRTAEYQRLEDSVCEQMPAVPVDFGMTTHLITKNKLDSAVPGFVSISTGEPLLRELYFK